jgi:RimJ/RimL family protein N-acetyltransferase
MENFHSESLLREITLKNGSSCRFYRADIGDSERIIEYINSIAAESDYLSFGRGEFAMRTEDERRLISSFKERSNCLMAVAECDQSIAGLITMQGGSRKRIYHWAEIALSVSKKYWGMGIGKALVGLAIEHAEKNGITRIGLKVRTDNARAITLYRKIGFENEGRLKRFMKVNDQYFDFYQMGRDI